MSAPSGDPSLRVSASPRLSIFPSLRQSAREAALLLLATLAAAIGTHFLHPRAPQWFAKNEPLAADEVTPDLVQQKWRGEVLWIDARSRQAFTAGHIPGALLLNEQDAEALMFEHIDKLQGNTKPIVVYCDGHACQASRKIAAYLRERLPGMQIYVLRGGWKAWEDRRGDVERH
jgi:rhodanese-related sulfurtransferase